MNWIKLRRHKAHSSAMADVWVNVDRIISIEPYKNDGCIVIFQGGSKDCFYCIPEEVFKILGSDFEEQARRLKQLRDRYQKPCIFVAFCPPWMVQKFTDEGLKYDLPVVADVQLAVRCLAQLYRYQQYLIKGYFPV